MNKELLEEIVSKRAKGTDGLMNIYFLKNDSWKKSGYTGCAAGLRQVPRDTQYLVSAFNGLYTCDNNYYIEGMFECPIARKYVDWLVNESPYSSTYASKDVDTIFDTGVFIQDAGCDSSLTANGCIAQRFLWEGGFQDLRYIWDMLCERGVNKSLAFVCSYLFKYTKGEGIVHTGQLRYGHTEPGSNRLGSEALKAFIFNKYGGEYGALNDSGGYTAGYLRASWGSDAGCQDLLRKIHGIEPKVSGVDIESVFDKGWEALYPIKTNDNSYPADPIMDAVAEFLIELEHKLFTE